MKKENLDLKKQFREAVSYLKESANYVYISIAVFLVSGVVGFVFHDSFTFIDDLLKELISKTTGLNTPEMVFFILQNNLQSAFFSLLFGIFLGIFPLVSAASNGVVLGYVLEKTYQAVGISSWWRLLPHGIFELPAIFISFGLGIKLGFSIFLPGKKRVRVFKKRFYDSANVFLTIIIPLLIVAAIIEGVLIGFFI